jgi:GNAT superfamily N-acetyltransferase
MTGAPSVTATRTYLEMRDRSAFKPAAAPSAEAEVHRLVACPPSFWRYLYTEVGRAYQWKDRLPWTDAQITSYLADPALELWLLTIAHVPAGYFELRRDADGGIEIAYFGLLPEFVGRGLGKYLLSVAVTRAWDAGASRVWLHTLTLDHPSALPNYLARGFTPFRTETVQV